VLEVYKAQVFLNALSLHLALLSELVCELGLGYQARELMRCWEHAEKWPEVPDLLDTRYRRLLEAVSRIE
jgi:hypothetical protein